MKTVCCRQMVDYSWNVMAHSDTQEGKWRGNWRMEWVASTLHTTSEHGVSSITTADAHTSAVSSRLNWRHCRFKWTRPFRRKSKSSFCACVITFQTQSTVSVFIDRGSLWYDKFFYVLVGPWEKYREKLSCVFHKYSYFVGLRLLHHLNTTFLKLAVLPFSSADLFRATVSVWEWAYVKGQFLFLSIASVSTIRQWKTLLSCVAVQHLLIWNSWSSDAQFWFQT